MWHCIVAALLLGVAVANAQEKQEHTFPTDDKIQLLLTQSERAFDAYAQAVEEEAEVAGDIAQAVSNDQKLLEQAHELLARLKKVPDGFNGPAGFLLVGDLDDASRNMAVCMGQAGMQAGLKGMTGKLSEGQQYLHLAQTCRDASMLIYTISESAFNMYSESLLAEAALRKDAMSNLEQCADALRKLNRAK
jgi:hypothetical protein